jgi:flagellar hook-associated protein 3 FlgL
MTMVSFGDLAQGFLLRAQTARLKTESLRVSQELASGRLSDVGKALSGDLGQLSSLARAQQVTGGYLSAARDAAFQAATVQGVIGFVADNSQAIIASLIGAPQNGNGAVPALIGTDARARLSAVLGALNNSASGRTLLAGTSVTGAAVADIDTMLTALRAEVAGAADPDDAIARISAWFDDPAGYGVTVYLGGPAQQDLPISPHDRVWLGATANDAAFRDVLKGLATAALVDDSVLSFSDTERKALASRAGEVVLASQDALTGLGARLGVSEGRIEAAQSRYQAELLSLELAQSDLVGADPYRLATELEAVQTNLEMLYSVTARLSRLNLTDFIR